MKLESLGQWCVVKMVDGTLLIVSDVNERDLHAGRWAAARSLPCHKPTLLDYLMSPTQSVVVWDRNSSQLLGTNTGDDAERLLKAENVCAARLHALQLGLTASPPEYYSARDRAEWRQVNTVYLNNTWTVGRVVTVSMLSSQIAMSLRVEIHKWPES